MTFGRSSSGKLLTKQIYFVRVWLTRLSYLRIVTPFHDCKSKSLAVPSRTCFRNYNILASKKTLVLRQATFFPLKWVVPRAHFSFLQYQERGVRSSDVEVRSLIHGLIAVLTRIWFADNRERAGSVHVRKPDLTRVRVLVADQKEKRCLEPRML